jgi:hypothetical protein
MGAEAKTVRSPCEAACARTAPGAPLVIAIALVAVAVLLALAALVAVALARTAAHADWELEQQLQRQARGEVEAPRGGYARLAAAHSAIAAEPSMTVPSSSTSVGTHWLPVNSFTSRRPRVRFSASGSQPKP